jgi:hypothetical protein
MGKGGKVIRKGRGHLRGEEGGGEYLRVCVEEGRGVGTKSGGKVRMVQGQRVSSRVRVWER